MFNVIYRFLPTEIMMLDLKNKSRHFMDSYGLTVCFPQNSLCWNPIPQCDSIWRWDVGEIMRFRFCHYYGTLMMGLLPLGEERSLSTPMGAMGAHSKRQLAVYRPGSRIRNWICCYLDLELPRPQNYKSMVFCYSSPSRGRHWLLCNIIKLFIN